MHRGRGQLCSVGAQQWDKGRWAQNKTQAGLCCEVPGEVGGGGEGGPQTHLCASLTLQLRVTPSIVL